MLMVRDVFSSYNLIWLRSHRCDSAACLRERSFFLFLEAQAFFLLRFLCSPSFIIRNERSLIAE